MSVKYTFEVVEKSSNKQVEVKRYDHVDSAYLKRLKQQVDSGRMVIYCSCRNRVELKFSNTQNPYLYPASRSVKHADDCCRNPKFQGESKYEKAWSYDETSDTHAVRLESAIPKIKGNPTEANPSERRKHIVSHGDSTSKGTATIFGMTTKLNMMAWEKIVFGYKQRIPDSREEMMKQVYGISRNIKIENMKKGLQTMFYDDFMRGKRISDLEVKKDVAFVYMEYLHEKGISIDEKNKLPYVSCKNVFGQERTFYINEPEFKKNLQLEAHSDTFILTGFVYRASAYHHRRMTLGNYCLIPVSNRGLYVESSYEKSVFDSFSVKGKRFIKPYLPIEEYGGFIPDFILYEEGKKDMIGEIFGIKGREDYEERKIEKLNLSVTQQFKEKYRFGYKDIK